MYIHPHTTVHTAKCAENALYSSHCLVICIYICSSAVQQCHLGPLVLRGGSGGPPRLTGGGWEDLWLARGGIGG